MIWLKRHGQCVFQNERLQTSQTGCCTVFLFLGPAPCSQLRPLLMQRYILSQKGSCDLMWFTGKHHFFQIRRSPKLGFFLTPFTESRHLGMAFHVIFLYSLFPTAKSRNFNSDLTDALRALPRFPPLQLTRSPLDWHWQHWQALEAHHMEAASPQHQSHHSSNRVAVSPVPHHIWNKVTP